MIKQFTVIALLSFTPGLAEPGLSQNSAQNPENRRLDHQLMITAKAGDTEGLRHILLAGAEASAADPDGTTALHWAVRGNVQEIVESLLTAGANPEVANRYGVTPLALAAENGNASIVELLLTAGANPNSTSAQGETVLMIAARTGQVAALDLLLDSGASIDQTENWRGQTALMSAAVENNTEAISRLVSAGGDIERRSTRGMTPLLFAVREGHISATRALLAAGANVNAGINNNTANSGAYEPASSGFTPPLALAIINAHFELGNILLEAGADPNLPDARGSMLHALAWVRRPGSGRPPLPTGNFESLTLAEALLKHGADPNRQIKWREIAFEVDLGIVKPPPNISVGRNFISFVGATPFYLAAKHGDVGYMKLLVEHGASPLTPTDQGVTPLMAAAGVGFWDGESPGPLNGTPDTTRLEAVKFALDLGNNLHAATDFGKTTLVGDGIELLLRHPVNLLDFDAQRDRGDMRWNGITALHGAAMMGSNLIVEYLIDQGADVNARNTLGWTPLMIAEGVFVANTEKAWPETVTLLRELGGETVE